MIRHFESADYAVREYGHGIMAVVDKTENMTYLQSSHEKQMLLLMLSSNLPRTEIDGYLMQVCKDTKKISVQPLCAFL